MTRDVMDLIDQANAVAELDLATAWQAQQVRAKLDQVPPEEDGLCGCGCGEPVEPARLALGYGLTLYCARRRERQRGMFTR